MLVSAASQDPDVSVRKRALDLLFTMCDSTNAADTVEELLKYLTVSKADTPATMACACTGCGTQCN